MSYVIYVDEMILWNTIINLAVINISSIILQEKIKLLRGFIFSFITALVTTVEYILTIRAEKYIHHIAYAGIYVIMIGIFFKIYNQGCILRYLLVSMMVMFILYGGLGLFFTGYITKNIKGISIIFLTSIISTYLLVYSKLIIPAKENKFKLNLNINDKKINLTGFLDTGNCLRDPYSGSPVIILDYRVLKKIASAKAYESILKYHKSGEFDYEGIKQEYKIDFYPLPYRTISTDFALMPAFISTSLIFTDLNYKVEKIVCGISRFKLKNNNEYQVLLNESLKPDRKEKFK